MRDSIDNRYGSSTFLCNSPRVEIGTLEIIGQLLSAVFETSEQNGFVISEILFQITVVETL